MSERTQRIAARIAQRLEAAWAGVDEWHEISVGSNVSGWFYATDVLKNGNFVGYQVLWWNDRRVPDKAKKTTWSSRDLRGRSIPMSEVPPKVVSQVQARL